MKVDNWRHKYPEDLFIYRSALKKWNDAELEIEEQEDDILFDAPSVINKLRETLLFIHQSKDQLYMLKR